MAIQCPKCGAGYDVTLFEFDHKVYCDCGAWVDLTVGHRRVNEDRKPQSRHDGRSCAANGNEKAVTVWLAMHYG
jgi:hypothetical protein